MAHLVLVPMRPRFIDVERSNSTITSAGSQGAATACCASATEPSAATVAKRDRRPMDDLTGGCVKQGPIQQLVLLVSETYIAAGVQQTRSLAARLARTTGPSGGPGLRRAGIARRGCPAPWGTGNRAR